MSKEKSGKLGILVSGGPAPGINSIISSATIRSILRGCEVVGIDRGYKWIRRGDVDHTRALTIDDVSRMHFRGGSMLGTARDDPAETKETLRATVNSLTRLGIDKLITIGGDGSAFKALGVADASGGRISVVHVPKTIDNDIDLPHGSDAAGYQTARSVGVELIKNLMIDAYTTSRWYLVTTMGRTAGHLALGIGKAAGATVTIIPEEFGDRKVPLSRVVDILAGTIIKRLADGRPDGVAVIAEGLMECIDTEDFADLHALGRDRYGQIRMGDAFEFTPLVRRKVLERLAEFGLKADINTKDIGYELRGATPVPADMELSRDLGFCAAQYILNGGHAAMVSFDNGIFTPIPFDQMVDDKRQRTRVRRVDIGSDYYYIARRYMLRLKSSDFNSDELIALYASVCGVTTTRFRKEFQYLVDEDLLIRILEQRRKERGDADADIMFR